MKRADLFKKISESLSVIIFLCGLAMLLGWIYDIYVLKSSLSGLPQIKTNATICFILTGLSLWLLQEKRMASRPGRFIARLAILLIFLIAYLTFTEFTSGVNLGIDQLLFKEPAGAILTVSPNRMAFTASINFMLIAIALILLEAKGEFFSYLAQSLVMMQGLIAGMTFLGFIYGAHLMYLKPGFSSAISLYGVILFIVVIFCFLFSRPERGFMKTVASEGPGGTIMRAIYPTIIIVTVFLGWLELYLEKLKISGENSIAVMTLAYIVAISTYLYLLCRILDTVDIVRKKAEEASRRLAAIVESSDDAIIGKAADGTILSWNKGAERLYGYSGGEVKGRNISVLVPPDRREELSQMYKRLGRGERIEHFETVRCKKDSHCIDVSLSVSPIRDEKGNLTGYATIARDISKKRETEKRLQESLRLKTDFVSLVSHELRTPLTAIKEGVALVADGTTGPLNDDQKEFLDIAKRNVDRLARLINDILDLQKLEGGKIFLNFTLNDMNEVVKEVSNTMEKMIKDKSLTIELELAEGLPKVMFDRDKIIQVTMNIISNAIKFTEKGKVTITTSRDENVVSVSVRDTGPGIRKEDIPKLFGRFEQLEKGTERKSGGTGLGLAISKEIIEIHGGKIWVESVFGEGATFFFNLPIVERRGSHGKEDTYSR